MQFCCVSIIKKLKSIKISMEYLKMIENTMVLMKVGTLLLPYYQDLRAIRFQPTNKHCFFDLINVYTKLFN